MSVFFSSDYITSVLGRIITSYNLLMVIMKLWVSGQVMIEPVMYDFFFNTALIEYICYYINQQRLKLFLKNEKSSY
jgi:hypothetical protein